MICTISVQDGKLPESMESRSSDSRYSGLPLVRSSRSSSNRHSMPWSVLKWYLTQTPSPAAFIHWKVCEPKPSIRRRLAGRPRSPNSQVNWWVSSGESPKKSQTLSGS